MEFLVDFLTQDNIDNTKVFPLLDCSKHEAMLLRELLIIYMRNGNEIEISTFLESIYLARDFETIPYLLELKHLTKLGWIRASVVGDSILEFKNALVSPDANLLKLLENGSIITSDIQEKIYNTTLEYLQDEWAYIDLIMQCNKIENLSSNHNLSSSCISYINELHKIINNNALKNAKKFRILEYFSKYRFNNLERLVFLLIAHAQYKGLAGLSLKDIVAIGTNDEEKLIIQRILSDKSKLLSNGLIAKETYGDFSFMEHEFFIPHNTFSAVILDGSTEKVSLQEEAERNGIFKVIIPKRGLDSLVLQDSIKDRFNTLLKHLDKKVYKKLKLWGIKDNTRVNSKILLYGDSGTGKTSSALALAKSLGQSVLSFDCSDILSMYVGESEKNSRKIFDEYKSISSRVSANPILLLDEADQLLMSRNDISGSASRMYHQMQNIFLEQIEKFEGILIATTNLENTLDSAFSRRFNYKIRFERPSSDLRKKIWDIHFPKNAIFSDDRDNMLSMLSVFDLSGAQIKLIVENTCYRVALREDSIFNYEDFADEIQKELDSGFGGVKKMGFIS